MKQKLLIVLRFVLIICLLSPLLFSVGCNAGRTYRTVTVEFISDVDCYSDSALKLVRQYAKTLILVAISKKTNELHVYVPDNSAEEFSKKIKENPNVVNAKVWGPIDFPSKEMTKTNKLELIIGFRPSMPCDSDLATNLAHVNKGKILNTDKDLNTMTVEVALNKMYSFITTTIRNKNVEFVETNYAVGELFYTPPDPWYSWQWHLNQIHCPIAWDYTTGNANVIVAILDTGVDYNHPDLKDNIWHDYNGNAGYDYGDNDPDPMDCFGHGTNCAGVVAEAMNNILGCGVAPRVKIMPVKVFRKVNQDGGPGCSLAANNSGQMEDIIQLLKGFEVTCLKDEYVAFFKKYDSAFAKLFTDDPALQSETTALITKYEPALRKLLGKGGYDMPLTGTDIQAITNLIGKIQTKMNVQNMNLAAPNSDFTMFCEGLKAQVNASSDSTIIQTLKNSIYYDQNKPMRDEIFEIDSHGLEIQPGWLASGIRYAANHGAKVISISCGLDHAYIDVDSALDYAYYQKDCVIVAAVGNYTTTDGYQVRYPATSQDVLSVSATTYGDSFWEKSCYGSAVEICAPGEDIYTTGMDDYDILTSNDGTSFSAPQVSGLAALLRSMYPGWANWQVREWICSTAVPLGPEGWDEKFGWGRVDAGAAITNYPAMSITVNGPVDFHVYDPNNRHIGRNNTTGIIERKMPHSYYTGPQETPQRIFILNPAGVYRVDLTGKGTGTYAFVVKGQTNQTVISQQTFTGTISSGQVIQFKVTATASGIPNRPSLTVSKVSAISD
ncbi:MAG: S8 family serine peptidase [Firmicutes bacterium]|nr:S8 family serine peptidase [Bacillota bacterium]